jgi:flagellin
MSRINSNISSMVAQRILLRQNSDLNMSLNRLSTGLRINTGRDDPSGLIASEGLRSANVAIGAALTNIDRANNVVGTAEGALDEINKLLTELEDLVDRSANRDGISDDERDANQLQIDAILDSIDRIANSTEFQGKKLLSGELEYQTSGVAASSFTDLAITSARIPTDGDRAVVVEVASAATLAGLSYSGSATGAATTTLEIAGNKGTEVLSFAASTSIADVADAVNQSTELTGVSATVSGSNLVFNSVEYGSSQFVSVKALEGTFAVSGGDTPDRDTGSDAVVRVNGVRANMDGITGRMQTTTLAMDFRLDESFGTVSSPTNMTFHVKGGGALFQVSPEISLQGQANLGIKKVSTSGLGTNESGFLSTLRSGQTNAMAFERFNTAQDIIREAQTQISQLRGRLGAFQKNTLDTTANSLRITLENTTAAESAIRDADFAFETSRLTRAQILVQSATNTLRIANSQPQNVLGLLG